MVECTDPKCPFHGRIKTHGRTFTGTIIKCDVHRTATVQWQRRYYLPKYERFEIRRTRLHVHNPMCINAKVGDNVKIAETRPLSKTKHFVIIEKLKEKI